MAQTPIGTSLGSCAFGCGQSVCNGQACAECSEVATELVLQGKRPRPAMVRKEVARRRDKRLTDQADQMAKRVQRGATGIRVSVPRDRCDLTV